ncbi:MAG: App1 family protein [Zoogloeaceae bacterium]|jgi:hypothetical protein|nr:App1 family protein [Zoogloeaceae bacterium]
MRRVLFLLFMTIALPALADNELEDDEYVRFIPGIAHDADDNAIEVEVNAFVYEKEDRPLVRLVLFALLDIDAEAITAQQKQRLKERSALFYLDFEGDKTFAVRFANGSVHAMPETRDGKSRGRFRLEKPKTPQREIRFAVDQPEFPANVEEGLAFYAAPEGVSAILDIDDTVKDSNVLDRKALMINTFLNEYRAVAGVGTILERLREKADAFHYVSASPIQLYPALREFFTRENFPRGSFHLREATDLRDLIPDREKLIAHKRQSIERLFAAYPQRKFILVGDTGENDPEIYAEFKRKYPDRVIEAIFHDITQEGQDSARFRDFMDLRLY